MGPSGKPVGWAAARVAGTPCKWNHLAAAVAPNAARVVDMPCKWSQDLAHGGWVLASRLTIRKKRELSIWLFGASAR